MNIRYRVTLTQCERNDAASLTTPRVNADRPRGAGADRRALCDREDDPPHGRRRASPRAPGEEQAARHGVQTVARASVARVSGKSGLASLVAWRRMGTAFALWLRDHARRMNCA
jgi:hypothetical protein